MKKVAIKKFIEANATVEENDENFRRSFVNKMYTEFADSDYTIQCDELNNGPAETNNNVFVVDVWESDTHPGPKYTRFTVSSKGIENEDRS